MNAIPSTWANGEEMLDESQNGINQALADPAFMEITSSMVITGNQVDVEVTVNPLADFTNANLRLHIAIVEDAYYYPGSATSQDNYYQVMRKMLPNGSGNTIGNLTKNVPVTINRSYTFTNVFNSATLPAQMSNDVYTTMSNLSAVAFMQNNVTKEVYQSSVAQKSVGLPTVSANGIKLDIFPNPLKDQAMIRLNLEESRDVTLAVYDLTGRMVWENHLGQKNSGSHQVTFDASNLTGGIYFVHVIAGADEVAQKIVVTR